MLVSSRKRILEQSFYGAQEEAYIDYRLYQCLLNWLLVLKNLSFWLSDERIEWDNILFIWIYDTLRNILPRPSEFCILFTVLLVFVQV